MATRRLFVSIDLPAALEDVVADVQAPFSKLEGLRLVEPAQAHLTLKFLGSVPEEDVDDVKERLHTAVIESGQPQFPVTVGGLGVFPSFDYISVIWCGLPQGASAVTDLHEAIESEMVAAGYDPEEHDFTPHTTIARMDHAASKEEVQQLVSARDPTVGAFTVSSVQLKESILTFKGPVYETIHEVLLPADGGKLDF